LPLTRRSVKPLVFKGWRGFFGRRHFHSDLRQIAAPLTV
jgi:hypothetical protein